MPMIYFKPLLRGRPRPPASQQTKILHKLGKLAVEEIRNEIDRSALKSKVDLKRSVKYKVYPSSVTLYSEHPAFKFMEEGVRPHVMAYVRNKVVPIELGDLKTPPTPRDFRQGIAFRKTGQQPEHPGYPAQRFVRKGIRKARKRLMESIMDDVRMSVRMK